MSFTKLISEQLAKAKINFDDKLLSRSDILEYILLEEAHCLDLMENEKLVCYHNEGTVGLHFQLCHEDGKRKGGPIIELIEPSKTKLDKANKLIHARFPQSQTVIDRSNNRQNALHQIMIPDANVRAAIRNSALFVAAGDLSKLSLNELVLTQEKLKAYTKIKRLESYAIVNALCEQLDYRLECQIRNSPFPVSAAKFNADKKIEALQEIRNQELVFLDSLVQLHEQGNELISKNKAYQSLSPVMNTLSQTLKTAREDFFNSEPSLENAQKLQQACQSAIEAAEKRFVLFQGGASFYNHLNPVLKGILNCCKAILGILAAVTIVPGLLVHKFSHQGFIGTFFKTETNLSYELGRFKEKLFEKDGILENVVAESRKFTS